MQFKIEYRLIERKIYGNVTECQIIVVLRIVQFQNKVKRAKM